MRFFSFLSNLYDSKGKDNPQSDIGNVYEDLKERVSNPLIASFLVSFFFCNWKVWISLLFESESTVKARGYNGFVEYINWLVTWVSAFVIPMGFALFYVFVFPYIRNYIRLFQARQLTKNNKDINDIAKGGVVSIDFYLRAKKDLIAVQKEHQKEIEEHLHIKSSWNIAETRLKNYEKREMDLMQETERIKLEKSEIDRLKVFSRGDFFVGCWLVSGFFVNGKATYVFFDEKGSIYLGSEFPTGMKNVAIGNITDINCNLIDMSVRVDFAKISITSQTIELFKLGYFRFSMVSTNSMQQVLENSKVYPWSRVNNNEQPIFSNS